MINLAQRQAGSAVRLKKWLWPAGLFSLALALRLYYAAQLVFPPLDDPAYYIQGARSIVAGHPLQLDITWNYFPPFETVRRPGFDFWMPLTSFLMAGMFWVAGDSLLAAQLPSVVGGALLAPLTFRLAARFFDRLAMEAALKFKLSLTAGLYIALNPLLAYQSAVPDSQMIYAPLVCAALLIVQSSKFKVQSKNHEPVAACLFGLLLGLAYITRSHAVFLGLAWAIAAVAGPLISGKKDRTFILKQAGFTLVGLLVIAGPWVVRTWLTFGFINSPAGLQSALIADYPTLFNYERPINFNSFAALGLEKIVQVRITALYNAWVQVLSVMFFPTVLLPLIGLVLLWRKTRIFNTGVLYGLLLSLGLPLIFVAASSTGSFYHSAGSLAPLGAAGYIYLLWLLSRWYSLRLKGRVAILPFLIAFVLLLQAAQLGVSFNSTVEVHQHDREVYSRLDGWLKANNGTAPVIADEPSTLNYVSGLAGLRLPADEPLEVVERLARSYNARYIVITGNFGRYPALLEASSNTRLPLAYRDPLGEFEIYSTGLK